MKKIISSAIAIAMLSSTVAMAATVVAPTPQTTTTTYIQTFDGCETNTENNYIDYGSGATNNDMKVSQGASSLVEVIQDPSTGAETGDKVLYQKHTGANGQASTYKINTNNLELGAKDVFTVSFDAALVAADAGASYIRFSIAKNGEVTNNAPKYTNVFRVMPAWVDGLDFTGDGDGTPVVGSPSKTSDKLTHYEIRFDRGKKTVKFITDGTKSETKSFKEGIDLESIQGFSVYFEHKGKAATETTAATEGGFYFDNVSYSVERVPDEKIETFDTLQNKTGGGWNKNQTLPNAKYKFNGEKVENTQSIDLVSNRGNVLKCSGSANSGNYVAMPLNYTMDDDDVFTFQFDYAEEKHNKDNTLVFNLEDVTAGTRNMGFTFTPTNPNADDNGVTYSTGSSTLFTITQGKIWIAGKWQSQGAVMSENEFHTITVVIDNSDETCLDASGNAQRTLAIYVDKKLQRDTKWIMTDNDGKESSNTINGVSLTFGGGYPIETRYFDNLWASLADNDIKVDGDNVSYTYPVVYDNATPAIFVKAYYDANNRLISADASASATPSAGRTVTTTLSAPEGTTKTKVFRWDNLNAIQNLSPAYDSSKVN